MYLVHCTIRNKKAYLGFYFERKSTFSLRLVSQKYSFYVKNISFTYELQSRAREFSFMKKMNGSNWCPFKMSID